MAKSMGTFYRHILAESWDLSRRHLFLWPLALFTSFVGVFGTYQVLFDVSETPSALSAAKMYSEVDFITSIFVGWSQSFDLIPWASLTLADLPALLFFFLLFLVIISLAVIVTSSQGGLIHALYQLQSKKKTTYLVSFRAGLDKFWLLFSINLIYRIFYLLVLSLIVMPILYLATVSSPGNSLLFVVVSYLVIIPLIVILDLVVRYTLMYIVVYQTKIADAFKNAWSLFAANWIISLETSLLIMVTLFAGFIVLSLVILPILAFFLTMFGTFIVLSTISFQIFVLTIVALLLIIVASFVSLFTTLQMSIWIGVFRRLTSGEHHSKIHRLARHLPFLHKRII